MDLKNEFITLVNKIANEALKNAALKMIDDAPEYFWTVAASSSGKFHPTISLGEGGLARHSIMTCVIAKDLLNAEIFIPYSDDNKDLVIVASLFHDIIKRGDSDNTEHTVFEHPILSSEFVKKHLIDAGIDMVLVETICTAIACHMGKWNTNKYSSVTLKKPLTPFEKLIHTADYMASRKYMKGLAHWQADLIDTQVN